MNETEHLDRSTVEMLERIRIKARQARRAAVQKKQARAAAHFHSTVQTEILQTGKHSTARIDRGCPND